MSTAPEACICVVGDGAAAVALVLKLVRAGAPSIRWYGGLNIKDDIEGTQHGQQRPYGVAYRTQHPDHLLNAPAHSMNIFDDLTFPAFLADQRERWTTAQDMHHHYARRTEYRHYLGYLLRTFWPQIGQQVNLLPMLMEVPTDFKSSGHKMVLCLGATHRQHRVERFPDMVQNPWTFDYHTLSESTRFALIFGSGLTAIDTAISIWSKRPKCHIQFVSRSGRLPQVSSAPVPGSVVPELETTLSLRALLRQLRQHADRWGWDQTFQVMRHRWKEVWRGLNLHDRERFLNRLRPYWEIQRHRMLPHTKAVMGRYSWSITRLHNFNQWSDPGTYDQVFNATGISIDPGENPLLSQLMIQRQIAPYPHWKMGLLADSECKVGVHIWCIGAYTRAERWESTAMADIVDQADIVVRQLIAK